MCSPNEKRVAQGTGRLSSSKSELLVYQPICMGRRPKGDPGGEGEYTPKNDRRWGNPSGKHNTYFGHANLCKWEKHSTIEKLQQHSNHHPPHTKGLQEEVRHQRRQSLSLSCLPSQWYQLCGLHAQLECGKEKTRGTRQENGQAGARSPLEN